MTPDVTIYYHPSCSKSQAALEALRTAGVEHVARNYLEDRLDVGQFVALANKVGDWRPLLREEGLGVELRRREETTAEEAAALVAREPEMLQRPVIVAGDEAVVARDPVTLRNFLAKLGATAERA